LNLNYFSIKKFLII
jgi:serine/threonine protein kinase